METIYYLLNPWWEERAFTTGIIRDRYVAPLAEVQSRRQVEVLVGGRRTGKTTILRQIISRLIASGISSKDVFYLALDHPTLVGTTISEHLKAFRKLFAHDRSRKLYLFFDEIQDSPDWEAELKALYDTEEIKVYCSGSTSALISRQGGKLTGRQIVTVIYPLSFSEFIEFRGQQPSLSEDYLFERLAEDYLQVGGYPEQVLAPSHEYLPNLLEDILARDLIRLFPIKKPGVLKDLIRLVSASVGSRTSFNRLSKLLGLSLDTAKEYIGHLEQAFLTCSLEKWTTSYSEKVYAQKKLYLWDTGIKSLFTGQGDEGARAENAVFMELKRRGMETGYFAEGDLEVDFVLGSRGKPIPLEVKMLDTLDLGDKRLAGLRLFLRRFPESDRALLVTKTISRAIDNFHGVPLEAIPLWRFLLKGESFE
ncbi:MAG TPA: ATP-binding protein [Syntrophorhabdaceae bacterium]|nr:ATP-binding protein [Syntrophorhabdaceae bacterium]